MKSKAKKQEELNIGKELFDKSEAVVFVDIAKVKTADLRNLRRELKNSGNPMFVLKKRLFETLMKKEGLPATHKGFKTSLATVFASNLEAAAQSIYKFFRALEKDKKIEVMKIMGGFDIKSKTALEDKKVIMIGQLPPREVLLAQLLGMISAPMRSLLYVLNEKAKRSSS